MQFEHQTLTGRQRPGLCRRNDEEVWLGRIKHMDWFGLNVIDTSMHTAASASTRRTHRAQRLRRNTTVDLPTAKLCWWINFLQVNLAIAAVFYLCVHKVKIIRRCRSLQTSSTDTLKDGYWSLACEKHPIKWCPRSIHRPRVSRSLVCRRAGRKDCSKFNLNVTGEACDVHSTLHVAH